MGLKRNRCKSNFIETAALSMQQHITAPIWHRDMLITWHGMPHMLKAIYTCTHTQLCSVSASQTALIELTTTHKLIPMAGSALSIHTLMRASTHISVGWQIQCIYAWKINVYAHLRAIKVNGFCWCEGADAYAGAHAETRIRMCVHAEVMFAVGDVSL